MLSPNIDLTENRDFSSHLPTLSVNRIIADEAMELTHSVAMSTEEFEKVFALEKMFGRRYHYTQVLDIFQIEESTFLYNSSTRCARCGKWILPWKRESSRNMNVCEECTIEMEGRVPWRPKNATVSFRRNDARDILQMG